MKFEFHVYRGDEFGAVADRAAVEVHSFSGDTSARSKAGALAKAANGPVDLAYSGDEPFNERYITTASPSEFHQKGYRFEKLT